MTTNICPNCKEGWLVRTWDSNKQLFKESCPICERIIWLPDQRKNKDRRNYAE